eukprot:CAMPEP_0174264546 /NCGR_PEP_ID=MMETSP0439-20130205/22806_1 /TAXON_ID=0 /ORGANISM="Stereomyxa ramosa, Strain Chinc5" /LENGTH=254 /DNA_ID=CAMNT_0015350463 /DNA_START=166 /DNA_END=930 /DNA_ORIENTATION=+
MVMTGTVYLEQSQGIKKAFTLPKPIEVAHYSRVIVAAGALTAGEHSYPYEFIAEPLPTKELYESYHGSNINVRYCIKVTIVRGFARKNVEKEFEFLIVKKSEDDFPPPKQVPFTIVRKKYRNKSDEEKEKLPFLIKGAITTTTCPVEEPLTGHLVVKKSNQEIDAIYIQLVRVETCGVQEGFIKEVTEIQALQIADGNVCEELPLTIYMVFPRVYTCPTTHSSLFKVEYEINIIVYFSDKTYISENLPILLIRP